MTTVFRFIEIESNRFIEIQSNLRRKKLHRTNKGSNFLGGIFSNRNNVNAKNIKLKSHEADENLWKISGV